MISIYPPVTVARSLAVLLACCTPWLLGCSEACLGDQISVDGKCTDTCSDDADCDSTDCVPADDEQPEGPRICASVADAGAGGSGPGSPIIDPECDSNDDCDRADLETACIEQQCIPLCELHAHCGSAGACTGEGTDAEGNSVAYCEEDSFPRETGQYGSSCPAGEQQCDSAGGFSCIGGGEGDSDAYCADVGCTADDECPSGFFCSTEVTAARPCEAACGLPANNDPNCVPAEDIGEGGEFICLGNRLARRACLQREFCNACESDADCRGVPGQICAEDAGGNRICTILCDSGNNSCPWGSAASCDVWDVRLGQPTCSHRAGVCSSGGQNCSPCIDDSDCALGVCTRNDFTGERFCVDLTVECSCGAGEATCVGGGCPLTPGGLEMNCVSAAAGQPPSVCFGATIVPGDPSSGLGCWPPEQSGF